LKLTRMLLHQLERREFITLIGGARPDKLLAFADEVIK